MDGSVGFNPAPVVPTTLRRGGLVTFTLPYATTLELVGRQKGIVLSLDEHNHFGQRPLICPIIYGENSVNETWGIKLKTNTGLTSYLRPDLASHIGIAYGQVEAVMRADESGPCIFPREVTRRARQKLIQIIQPTAEKFDQRRRLEFLGYGEIGQAHGFPRADQDINDKAPILNLTPPEVYQQTGMALLARAFSHYENYNPLYHIAVGTNRWFDVGYFSTTSIRVLPIKGTLAQSMGWKPLPAGERALKGFGKKADGTLDADARQQITARYTTPVGQLPAHVLATQGNKQGNGSIRHCRF